PSSVRSTGAFMVKPAPAGPNWMLALSMLALADQVTMPTVGISELTSALVIMMLHDPLASPPVVTVALDDVAPPAPVVGLPPVTLLVTALPAPPTPLVVPPDVPFVAPPVVVTPPGPVLLLLF